MAACPRLLALLLTATLVASLGAQDSRQPAPAPVDDAHWKVFSAEQPLAELLDACSLLIDQSIVYTPSDVSGNVSLELQKGVTADALWNLVNEALVSRGLTTVQIAGSDALQVVQLPLASGLARVEQFQTHRTKAGFIRILFRPDHEKAETLAEGVKLLLSKSGSVSALRDPSAIVVADLRPNVLEASHLLSILDAGLDDLSVEEVPLRAASPVALVATLEQIANAKKSVFGDKFRGTVIASPARKSVLVIAPDTSRPGLVALVKQFDSAEPVTTVHYSPRRFGVHETAKLVEAVVFADSDTPKNWRIVIDDLTGSVVVTASSSQHAEIEKLFDRLESTELGPRRAIRSYPIKNRNVDDVAKLLDRLVSQGVLDVPPSDVKADKPQGATAPLPTNVVSAQKGTPLDLSISADSSTNRLIAVGEARVLDELERLIQTLDVKASQVLVESLVVTLTEAQTEQLGVELQAAGVSGDTLFRLSSLFGLGSPDPSKSSLPPPGGTGATGVILNPGDFSGVLHALATVNHGRSVSLPKVLVNNHQEAKLGSTLQSPYLSTNASNTVATTSFGGTVEAGTTISIKPQIAEGNALVLDYSVSISSFVGAPADPTLPPPRQENKLSSSATVPDGFTVVVGGLEVDSENKANSHVPILGDLPILGSLFSNRSADHSKSRFFVFIRASVLRNGAFEDLKFISSRDLATANLPDGFPVLEPRVMR